MESDLPLFTYQPKGETFNVARDGLRLKLQLSLVYEHMKDGAWHTLRELSEKTRFPEASISARLRDLRNQMGFTVEREYVARGLHRYKLHP